MDTSYYSNIHSETSGSHYTYKCIIVCVMLELYYLSYCGLNKLETIFSFSTIPVDATSQELLNHAGSAVY